MDTSLTAVQKRILDFLASFIEDQGFPPSLADIARACGIANRSSVDYHLGVLQSRGLLRRAQSRHRGLELLSHPFRLPVLGRVSAGAGVIAREDVEEYLTLDRKLCRGAAFLLKVRGDSMTGVGIMEGDLVQVRREGRPDEGDIVVALVGEEAVVKRLKKAGRTWVLESANPRYAPIRSEFELVGKVVGLIRRYGR